MNDAQKQCEEAMKLYESRGWARFGAITWHVCKFSFYAGVQYGRKHKKD